MKELDNLKDERYMYYCGTAIEIVDDMLTYIKNPSKELINQILKKPFIYK